MQVVECGNELVQTKDKLHSQFFNLQLEPKTVKREFSTLLDKASTDDLLLKIEAAFARAKECDVDEKLRQVGLEYLASAKKRRLGWDKERSSGVLYYSGPPASVTEFVDTDLNYAINIIHNLGAALLKSSGHYAGCSIIGDLNSVNRGSLAFCEGVPIHYGTHIGHMMDGGEKIEEDLGCHRAVAYITEGQNGYDIDLELTVPGAMSASERLEGVRDVLQADFKQECTLAGKSLKCKGSTDNLDEFRQLAYFMDSIADVDLLLKKCVPVAIEHAKTKAKEAVAKLGDGTYLMLPTPRSSGDWAKKVCPDVYENWEKNKANEIVESLQADINNFMERADQKLDQAKNAACSIDKYRAIKDGEGMATNAKWICEDLVKRTGEDETKCRRLRDDWKVKAEVISQGIVQSCPPAPLIDAAEKKTPADKEFEHTSDYIALRMVCQLAFDDACETELYKATLRHNLRRTQAEMDENVKVAYNNLKSALGYEFVGECAIDRFDFIHDAQAYIDSALTLCHAAASQTQTIEGGRVNFRQCNDLGEKWRQDAAVEAKKLLARCPVTPMIDAAELEVASFYNFENSFSYGTFETVCKLAEDSACLSALQEALVRHNARES